MTLMTQKILIMVLTTLVTMGVGVVLAVLGWQVLGMLLVTVVGLNIGFQVGEIEAELRGRK